MIETPKDVKVGLRFLYNHADSRFYFRVVRKAAKGLWECVCDDDQDYAGAKEYLTSETILGAIEMEALFSNIFDENEEWLSSLEDGVVVHLSHGFHQFVRCVVETGEYVDGREEKFGKRLIPIALVGDWRPFDLPRRMANGSISYPYHAKMIVESTPYRPGPQNLWESPYFQNSSLKDKDGDPRNLDPISLDVPGMTPDEERASNMEIIKERVICLLSNGVPSPEMFEEAIEILRTHSDQG